MQDIFWGAVIIGVGLLLGESIFLGEVSLISVFFDGLGLFFVGQGALAVYRQRQA